MLIKTMWYWQRNRHTYQWKRIENSEPSKHAQLIFVKGAKVIQWRENKWSWSNWTWIDKTKQNKNPPQPIILY